MQEVIAQSRPYVVRVETNACDPEDGALGSGYLIDATHVVTVAHVIENARGLGDYRDIAVRSVDRGVTKARVVGIDPTRDLALLELKSSLAVTTAGAALGLEFASRPAREGDAVVALGYPDGFPLGSFQGHVVGLNRSVTVDGRSLTGMLQYDASVTQGNSGGPVLSEDGRVVGLTDAGAEGTDALNLAITGVSPYVLAWLAKPVIQPANNCVWDMGIDIRSQHAEASGIGTTVVEWLTGKGRGYSTLFGEALKRAGSEQAYIDATEAVSRTSIVLMPTVEWVSETADSAEVTYRETGAAGCTTHHVRLMLTTAMGWWKISSVTDAEAPKPC